ncbi:UNVERIFIED_CONTAM: hypothetical protein Sradi_0190100 [Sesamum radiatum]|uniref:Uncharacterized protein n=1 Tax=Sesamum radiatum TaxID=300843 RepID=A0AAW2W3B4_SESRA
MMLKVCQDTQQELVVAVTERPIGDSHLATTRSEMRHIPYEDGEAVGHKEEMMQNLGTIPLQFTSQHLFTVR